MPRNARPRKPYKPKPVGRPVMRQMRDELILPAYSALTALQRSNDADALESARHTLAALYNYVGISVDGARRQVIVIGLDAIKAMDARHERTGKYRPTGGEMLALREAVAVCDWALPTLRTDELVDSIAAVNKALFGVPKEVA